MDPIDREALVLRHFEDLTNAEVAHELGLNESAASKRYIRALRQLKEILATLPGGLGDSNHERHGDGKKFGHGPQCEDKQRP